MNTTLTRLTFLAMLLAAAGCMNVSEIYPDQPRGSDEWRQFWFPEEPTDRTPIRVHGSVGPGGPF